MYRFSFLQFLYMSFFLISCDSLPFSSSESEQAKQSNPFQGEWLYQDTILGNQYHLNLSGNDYGHLEITGAERYAFNGNFKFTWNSETYAFDVYWMDAHVEDGSVFIASPNSTFESLLRFENDGKHITLQWGNSFEVRPTEFSQGQQRYVNKALINRPMFKSISPYSIDENGIYSYQMIAVDSQYSADQLIYHYTIPQYSGDKLPSFSLKNGIFEFRTKTTIDGAALEVNFNYLNMVFSVCNPEGMCDFQTVKLGNNGNSYNYDPKNNNNGNNMEGNSYNNGILFHDNGAYYESNVVGRAHVMGRGLIVVGNPFDRSLKTTEEQVSSGRVLVFQAKDGNYVQVQEISPPNPQTNGNFGYSLAFNGDYLMIGAPMEKPSSPPYLQTGQVHVYLRTDSNEVFKYLGILPHQTELHDNSQFGYSIALTQSQVIVGAPFQYLNETSEDCGKVYNYHLNATSQSWESKTPITPEVCTDQLRFGTSVAMSSNLITIGSPGYTGTEADRLKNLSHLAGAFTQDLPSPTGGAVWIYNQVNEVWNFYRPFWGTLDNMYLGNSVAIDKGSIVVSGRGLDNQENTGSAFVIRVLITEEVISDIDPKRLAIPQNFHTLQVAIIENFAIITGSMVENNNVFYNTNVYTHNDGIWNPSHIKIFDIGGSISFSDQGLAIGASMDSNNPTYMRIQKIETITTNN